MQSQPLPDAFPLLLSAWVRVRKESKEAVSSGTLQEGDHSLQELSAGGKGTEDCRGSEEAPGLASAVRKASVQTGAADQLAQYSKHGNLPVQRPRSAREHSVAESVTVRHSGSLVGSVGMGGTWLEREQPAS